MVAASTSTVNDGAVTVFVVVVLAACALYMAPTIVAIARRVPNVGSVAAINLLLGWSLVGWAMSWALALRSRPQPRVFLRRRRRRRRQAGIRIRYAGHDCGSGPATGGLTPSRTSPPTQRDAPARAGPACPDRVVGGRPVSTPTGRPHSEVAALFEDWLEVRQASNRITSPANGRRLPR